MHIFLLIRPQASHHLGSLVSSIELDVLSQAAFRIGAHSRALKYLEMYAREKHRISRSKELINSTNISQNNIYNSAETSVHNETNQIFVLPKFRRKDYANHELPVLTSEELDQLMKVLIHLEDPDAIEGVQSVRKISGFTSTSWHRILECEHAEDWIGVMLEHDVKLHSQLTTSSSLGLLPGTAAGTATAAATTAVTATAASLPVSTPVSNKTPYTKLLGTVMTNLNQVKSTFHDVISSYNFIVYS